MASPQLVDACRMWCAMKGIEPKSLGHDITKALVEQAVKDYPGDFSKLNERQRAMIAGLKD